MNTDNETHVEPCVEKLEHLSIDGEERKPCREYSLSDTVPVDERAFHYMQATTINDGIPAFTPDINVLLYLKDFIPAKRTKLSANSNQDLKSNKTSLQQLKENIDIGSGEDCHTSLSAEKDINADADDLKYRIQEDPISCHFGVTGTDVERNSNGKRRRV